jgi:hypothetical protein
LVLFPSSDEHDMREIVGYGPLGRDTLKHLTMSNIQNNSFKQCGTSLSNSYKVGFISLFMYVEVLFKVQRTILFPLFRNLEKAIKHCGPIGKMKS